MIDSAANTEENNMYTHKKKSENRFKRNILLSINEGENVLEQ